MLVLRSFHYRGETFKLKGMLAIKLMLLQMFLHFNVVKQQATGAVFTLCNLF
jgi:hypothetical protein